jgi:hypothetical protein
MNLEAEFIYLYPNFLQNLFVTDSAAEFLGEKKKKKKNIEFGYGKKKSESGAQYSLNGPVGQVNALEFVNDLLFAGVESEHLCYQFIFLEFSN